MVCRLELGRLSMGTAPLTSTLVFARTPASPVPLCLEPASPSA
jgi:hypothetical protein